MTDETIAIQADDLLRRRLHLDDPAALAELTDLSDALYRAGWRDGQAAQAKAAAASGPAPIPMRIVEMPPRVTRRKVTRDRSGQITETLEVTEDVQ